MKYLSSASSERPLSRFDAFPFKPASLSGSFFAPSWLRTGAWPVLGDPFARSLDRSLLDGEKRTVARDPCLRPDLENRHGAPRINATN